MTSPRSTRLRPVHAGRGPAVRAVLVIVLPAKRGVAEFPPEWRCATAPAGVVVRVDVGTARYFFDCWDELPGVLRDCAEVEIVGTDAEGIAAVHASLTRQADRTGSPAC